MGFFIAGGWGMFPVLLIGLALLAFGGAFMFRANPRHLAILRALTAAEIFGVVGSVSYNVTTVAWKTTTIEELSNDPKFHQVVIYGLGEAITPVPVGFICLMLAWIFIAVGMRRVQELAS